MNLKRQLLVLIFLVGSSPVRSTPVESLPDLLERAPPPRPAATVAHNSRRPSAISRPTVPAGVVENPLQTTVAAPTTPSGSPPPAADEALPPAPVGADHNCQGSGYCHSGSYDHQIAQNAINGWESFVFYRPGTAYVASHGDYGRTAILRCPGGYSGPGFIGKQIKEALQSVLDSLKTSLTRSAS
ncbi:hypothetical protein MMC22_008232 [Lobaria immixta]|nr:hypothetical protein [Lobaria immixta]